MAIVLGLKKAFRAIMTANSDVSAIYDVPVACKDIRTVDIKISKQSIDVPGDDTIITSIYDVDGADVSLEFAQQSSSERAIFLGEKRLTNGIIVSGGLVDPPEMAFGYMKTMTGGVSRYVWLLRCKFSQPDDTSETKEPGTIKPQYPKIDGKASKRFADDMWKFSIDSDDPIFTALIGTNWFTKATLETLANAVITTYGNPAIVNFVTVLPAIGVAGHIYVILVNGESHYWNGTAFIKNGDAV